MTPHLPRGTDDPTLPVSARWVAFARRQRVDQWQRRGRGDGLHDAIDAIDAIDDVGAPLLAVQAGAGCARRGPDTPFEALALARRPAVVPTKLEGPPVAEAASNQLQVQRRRLADRVQDDRRALNGPAEGLRR